MLGEYIVTNGCVHPFRYEVTVDLTLLGSVKADLRQAFNEFDHLNRQGDGLLLSALVVDHGHDSTERTVVFTVFSLCFHSERMLGFRNGDARRHAYLAVDAARISPPGPLPTRL